MDIILIAPLEKLIDISGKTYRASDFRPYEELVRNPLGKMFISRLRENLGINTLASVLRGQGYQVEIINCNIQNQSVIDVINRINEKKPKLVGLSIIYEAHLYNAFEIAYQVKQLNNPPHITLGGASATFNFYQLLLGLDFIDTIVLGEGELSFPCLVDCVLNNKSYRHLRGIAFKENNKIIENPRFPLADMNTIPAPARDSLQYIKEKGISSGIATMYTSRGCLNLCLFCNGKNVYRMNNKQTYRFKDPGLIIEEIEYLVKNFAVSFIYFNDDNFFGYKNLGLERIEILAKEIIRRKIKINFAVEVRADALDIDLLKLLKESGLSRVLLGIESGSEQCLHWLKKGSTVEKNRQAIKVINEIGLELEPSLILVNPLTTVTELEETTHFIKSTGIYHYRHPLHFINNMEVYPGSDLEKNLLQEKLIITDDTNFSNYQYPRDKNQIIKKLSSRDYQFQDHHIALFWDHIKEESNQLEEIIEKGLPDLLAQWKKNIKKNKQQSQGDDIAVLNKINQWRKNIGTLIVQLLEKSVAFFKTNSDLSNKLFLQEKLKEELSLIRNEYDQKYLGESINRFILNIKENMNG